PYAVIQSRKQVRVQVDHKIDSELFIFSKPVKHLGLKKLSPFTVYISLLIIAVAVLVSARTWQGIENHADVCKLIDVYNPLKVQHKFLLRIIGAENIHT